MTFASQNLPILMLGAGFVGFSLIVYVFIMGVKEKLNHKMA